MMDFSHWQQQAQSLRYLVLGWLTSVQFYAQVSAIIMAWLIVHYVACALVLRLWLFNAEPLAGRFWALRRFIYSCRDLVRPFLLFVLLAIAVQICDYMVGSSWLVRAAQSLAVISLLYAAVNRFVQPPLIQAAARWIGIPAATIYAFGYMPQVIYWMDRTAFEAGNVRISLLIIFKAVLFGGSLFWLGRLSSRAGERVIHQQLALDVQTRQLAAKGFDLFVICCTGLLLLNLLGIDLSILAVFSGALGVGLGFGLQRIASNFLSGVIILLERSLKVGDFIELEDGRSGYLMEINMRQSRLGTSDGKDIMVPNDRFITTRVVNWTHANPRQRYEAAFTVTYDTDIRKVPDLIVQALLKIEGVLHAPEMPECVLKSFGDANINFVAKFWMEGVDDGAHNYTSDVLFAIWDTLKQAGISMKPPPAKVQYVAVPAPEPQPRPRKSKT